MQPVKRLRFVFLMGWKLESDTDFHIDIDFHLNLTQNHKKEKGNPLTSGAFFK